MGIRGSRGPLRPQVPGGPQICDPGCQGQAHLVQAGPRIGREGAVRQAGRERQRHVGALDRVQKVRKSARLRSLVVLQFSKSSLDALGPKLPWPQTTTTTGASLILLYKFC